MTTRPSTAPTVEDLTRRDAHAAAPAAPAVVGDGDAPMRRGGSTLSRPSLGWRVVAAGVATAVALLALLLLAQRLLGRWPFGDGGSARDVRIAALHCLLAVYMPFGFHWAVRSARDRMDALRPHLLPSAGDSALDDPAPPRRVLLAAAMLGLLWALFGPYLMEPGVATPLAWWRPSGWAPETVWHRALGLWIGPWAFCLAAAMLTASRRFSRLAALLRPIDLFDPRPLAPFVHQALANALLATGVATLMAAFAYDFGAAVQVLGTAIFNLALLAAAVLLPLGGVRRRVRDAKRAELAWCDAELARLRAHLHADAHAPHAPAGRLADVAAQHAAVSRVPELPFDSPALRRLALYVLVPLGSWIASTVVQHLVERALLAP